jgi:hypothetical protein
MDKKNYLTILAEVLALSLREKINLIVDTLRCIPQENRYLLLIDIFSKTDKRTLNDSLNVVKAKNFLDKTVKTLNENDSSELMQSFNLLTDTLESRP